MLDSTETPDAPAPLLPPGMEWINTETALDLERLRGKVVLLYFWTASSLPCRGMMPRLARLGEARALELVLVGAHSAKFERERSTETVRAAVERLGLVHPVVNDAEFALWRRFGVRAWPTFFLLDPEGRVVAQATGIEAMDDLDAAIGSLIESSERAGTLQRRPVPGVRSARETEARPAGMRYPAGLLADPRQGRLFVADTGGHRILEADLESGQVRRIIGAGQVGLVDGPFHRARFRRPLGLALLGEHLYVADSGNHAVREIDLAREMVRTVAGTGAPSVRAAERGGRWPGRETALSYPHGLAVAGHSLYIAMAGCHQIWRLDLEREDLALHAGTGEEGLVDGPHASAVLAQPSGLVADGERIWFVDAGASAVRSCGLGSDGEVRTVIGGGLFEFGLADGSREEARLQYPLGVACDRGRLFVADAYNDAIRVIGAATGEVSTLAASGEGAWREPSAVAVQGDHVFVADTLHHRVARVRIEDGQTTAWRVRLTETIPTPTAASLRPAVAGDLAEEVEDLPAVGLAEGTGQLWLDLALPRGFRINAAAPFDLMVTGDGAVEVIGEPFRLRTGAPRFPVGLPLHVRGEGTLRVELAVFFCEEPDERICYYRTVRRHVPVRVVERRPGDEARVVVSIEAPEAPL